MDHFAASTDSAPPHAARDTISLLCARAHGWLVLNQTSTRIHRSFPAKLLPTWSSNSINRCLGLFLPNVQEFALPLVELRFFILKNITLKQGFQAHKEKEVKHFTWLYLTTRCFCPFIHCAKRLKKKIFWDSFGYFSFCTLLSSLIFRDWYSKSNIRK